MQKYRLKPKSVTAAEYRHGPDGIYWTGPINEGDYIVDVGDNHPIVLIAAAFEALFELVKKAPAKKKAAKKKATKK